MITEEMIVLVHDAARCCVTQEVIDRVVAGVINHGAVTAAVPVVDSLCRARDGVIQGYVDRTDAWAIQTPQGFVATDLMKAHTAAREEGTQALDDAALVATFRPVHIVQGDRFNIKVTQPEDLSVAGSIVGRR
jgi:2-C-methyl-D-erythritol 4-phosphate cytidylyltransferase